MPKTPSFPTLFDEVLQLSISKLKEWGYLEPNQIKRGTSSWSSNGNRTGSISITVNTSVKQPYIELDYKYRDEPKNYKVSIVSIRSNLGKGLIPYFLCPNTNRLCRKLYSIGGLFLHREAFAGCMYQSQTESKYYRGLKYTSWGSDMVCDNLFQETYSKHFRTHYKGRPTKRYLRILTKINKLAPIPPDELRNLLTQ